MILSLNFWNCYPALLYGIAVMMGSALSLYSLESPWLFALCILFLPTLFVKCQQSRARLLLALLLGISCCYLTHVRYQFPKKPVTKNGIAHVDITSVAQIKTPFGPIWSYDGILKNFTSNNSIIAKGIPVRLSIPYEKQTSRPIVGIRYLMESHLKQTVDGSYALSPVKGKPWIPLQQVSYLSEWRYAAKSGMQQHLEDSIKDPHISAFLSGIITGEFDDRLLAFDLGRFGLQHLMAISGFHFSILAALFGFFLSLFVTRKVGAAILIILMTAYFVFLGEAPSVIRSWIAIVIGLGALFVERQSVALNSLGIGLIAVVLLEPLSMREIGFQFSFGVTASILLWYSPCERLLHKLFAKRNLSQVVLMDHWDQHGYCFLHWLKQALALGIAVNLVALPLTLYHFHKFPLMGLVYNLFFPAMVSVSMLLLILGFACALLFPEAANLVHSINETYTGTLLNLTAYFPKSFDAATWRIAEVESSWLFAYLCVVFVTGAVLKDRYNNE